MPGHKGKSFIGCEDIDITEINGADSLFEAKGIIAESEGYASEIFGCDTFYSTEGSSLCIRAMLYMMKKYDSDFKLFAVRNSHKSFISALALLDISVEWIYGSGNYLECKIDKDALSKTLSEDKSKTKVLYITSPDYLGNVADIKAISDICKKSNTYLLVDNAHGAYLRFLKDDMHPITNGALMCCDSAHKTFGVLTGGAYLHISKDAPEFFKSNVKSAMSLFASTSPSYLILQSLDMANMRLANGYGETLECFINELNKTKERISALGYELTGDEELKIVISAKKYGYYGYELAEFLEQNGVFCEFADRDYLVLMLTPQNSVDELSKLVDTLALIPKKPPINENIPSVNKQKTAFSPRETIFMESEEIDVEKSLGRVLSQFNIACPPAVPIVVCGEIIDESAIECFKYYGIKTVSVVK